MLIAFRPESTDTETGVPKQEKPSRGSINAANPVVLMSSSSHIGSTIP